MPVFFCNVTLSHFVSSDLLFFLPIALIELFLHPELLISFTLFYMFSSPLLLLSFSLGLTKACFYLRLQRFANIHLLQTCFNNSNHMSKQKSFGQNDWNSARWRKFLSTDFLWCKNQQHLKFTKIHWWQKFCPTEFLQIKSGKVDKTSDGWLNICSTKFESYESFVR